MPGLAQLAGIGPLIEFGDRHVQVVGRRLRHLGEIESQIMWIRNDPVRIATSLVSQIEDRETRVRVSESLIRLVRRKHSGAASSILNKWMASFEGRLFSVWQAVRDSGVSYDQSIETCCNSIDEHGIRWLESVEYAIDIASNHAEYQQIIEIATTRKTGSAPYEDGFTNYDSIIRNLCREPYNMPINSVLDLTLYQITVIARPPEDTMSDEREVESSQAKHLNEMDNKVLWGDRYRPLAENMADGKNLMSGLRS